ncbi:MAG TPA: hypothetical protein VKT32_12470 [Chthonomonadaceae bacterium]|nr:hypothetical protein [Chthonomonadaceae bacterium]
MGGAIPQIFAHPPPAETPGFSLCPRRQPLLLFAIALCGALIM